MVEGMEKFTIKFRDRQEVTVEASSISDAKKKAIAKAGKKMRDVIGCKRTPQPVKPKPVSPEVRDRRPADHHSYWNLIYGDM